MATYLEKEGAMRDRTMGIAAAIVMGAVLLSGCGGGDDDATINMTGVWVGWGDITGTSITATLTQNGDTVTGTFVDGEGDTGTFTGTVVGDHVDLVFAYDEYSNHGDITGTVSSNSGSGTWAAIGYTGTWTATKQT